MTVNTFLRLRKKKYLHCTREILPVSDSAPVNLRVGNIGRHRGHLRQTYTRFWRLKIFSLPGNRSQVYLNWTDGINITRCQLSLQMENISGFSIAGKSNFWWSLKKIIEGMSAFVIRRKYLVRNSWFSRLDWGLFHSNYPRCRARQNFV